MRVASLRGLLIARGLRAFGDGYISLLLPVYLLALGFTPFEVGVIATGTLLGSGCADARRRPLRRIASTSARCCSPPRR